MRIGLGFFLFLTAAFPTMAQQKPPLGLRLELKNDDDNRRVVVHLENLTDKPLTLRDIYTKEWAFMPYLWLAAEVDGRPDESWVCKGAFRLDEAKEGSKPEKVIPAKGSLTLGVVFLVSEGYPTKAGGYDPELTLPHGEHVLRLFLADDIVKENKLGKSPSATVKVKVPPVASKK